MLSILLRLGSVFAFSCSCFGICCELLLLLAAPLSSVGSCYRILKALRAEVPKRPQPLRAVDHVCEVPPGPSAVFAPCARSNPFRLERMNPSTAIATSASAFSNFSRAHMQPARARRGSATAESNLCNNWFL